MAAFVCLYLGAASSGQTRAKFEYRQDFRSAAAPAAGQRTTYPLHFDDVCESNKLSSWSRSNWMLTGDGVAAAGSRVEQIRQRGESVAREYYGGASYAHIRGFRMPWLTLYMGEEAWADYTLETAITPAMDPTAGEQTSAGVAFRYQNGRQYYALLLDKAGRAELVFRPQDREFEAGHPAWEILGTAPLKVTPGATYKVRVSVQGDRIVCDVDGKTLIERRDTRLSWGKVALLADNPARFGPVRVSGELERRPLPPLPRSAQPRLAHEVKLPPFAGERTLWFEDLDGDGTFEIIVCEQNGLGHGGRPPAPRKGAYRALKLDGTQIWEITGFDRPMGQNNGPLLAVFDINGDGRNEVVLPHGFEIQVRDAVTGKLMFSAPTPKPNPYFGGRKSPYELLVPDGIRPIRINPNRPPGLYVKDSYQNVWVYDHLLNLLWHRPAGTGHWPLPVDVNGDGRDELLCSNSLLDAEGRLLWDLGLEDHADNIILHRSLDPGNQPARFYIAHGEAGMLEVDPLAGRLRSRGNLGHVQAIDVGRFAPDQPGEQIVAYTKWREDRIHYLFDKDMKILSTWVGPVGPSGAEGWYVTALRWGENGQDLLLTSKGILDPMTGRVVVPAFGEGEPVYRNNWKWIVLDHTPWGGQVVPVYGGDKIQFFAPQWR